MFSDETLKKAMKTAELVIGRALTDAEVKAAIETLKEIPDRHKVEGYCMDAVDTLIATSKDSKNEALCRVMDHPVPVIAACMYRWAKKLFPSNMHQVKLVCGTLDIVILTTRNKAIIEASTPEKTESFDTATTGNAAVERDADGRIALLTGHAYVEMTAVNPMLIALLTLQGAGTTLRLDPSLMDVANGAAEKYFKDHPGERGDAPDGGCEVAVSFKSADAVSDEIEKLISGGGDGGAFALAAETAFSISEIIAENGGKRPVIC